MLWLGVKIRCLVAHKELTGMKLFVTESVAAHMNLEAHDMECAIFDGDVFARDRECGSS